jgi:Tol biopolymer transport system component
VSGVLLNSPVWSSDAKWIFYGLSKNSGVYRKRVEGGSDGELVFPRHEILSIPRSLSRDGRYLLLDAGRHDLGLAVLNGGVAGSPPWFMLLPPATFTQMEAELSPDQRWLAYVSDESGRAEVYVRRFSAAKAGKPPSVSKRFLVSKGGGNSPSWRNDGRQLSYLAPGGAVMAVEVRDHPEVPVGEPRILVKLPAGVKLATLTPDQRGLLAAMPIGSGEPAPITVIRNWQSELKGSQK